MYFNNYVREVKDSCDYFDVYKLYKKDFVKDSFCFVDDRANFVMYNTITDVSINYNFLYLINLFSNYFVNDLLDYFRDSYVFDNYYYWQQYISDIVKVRKDFLDFYLYLYDVTYVGFTHPCFLLNNKFFIVCDGFILNFFDVLTNFSKCVNYLEKDFVHFIVHNCKDVLFFSLTKDIYSKYDYNTNTFKQYKFSLLNFIDFFHNCWLLALSKFLIPLYSVTFSAYPRFGFTYTSVYSSSKDNVYVFDRNVYIDYFIYYSYEYY